MTTIDRPALEKLSIKIRGELKAWEKRFQDDHEGRKASRDDIKADTFIASKYSEYNRTRDILAGKIAPPKQKRGRAETKAKESPSKRNRSLHDSPQEKDTTDSAIEDGIISSTPTIKRTFIGPTPQKDGIVLGIFDLLTSETPSRSRTTLGDIAPNVAATPSRTRNGTFDTPRQYEERARGSRTPASSGKRFMLDAFVTPQKRRSEEEASPSSSYKKCITPAFLRRDNFVMDVINEAPETPRVARPWARRSFGRSLSGMIKDMRKEQEKQADEELDLLRDLEEEEAMMAEGRTVIPKQVATDHDVPEIVVEASQAPGGLDRDGFVLSDVEIEASEPEAETNMSRKPWKKKGLKRQTRRNNMRPVAKKVHARPTEDEPPDDGNSEGDLVAETQLPEELPMDAEDDGSDYELDESEVRVNTGKEKALKTQASAKTTAEKSSRPARKVKADAHANYRALKIKNKNSKGKGRGRFGRGR